MSRRYSSYTWTEICAFWGMIIASVSYIFSGLFRFLVNWINDISHDVASILGLVSNIMSLLGSIALLVAIAIPAWQYVKYRSKGWKVVYWIALVVYVLGVGFGMLSAFRT